MFTDGSIVRSIIKMLSSHLIISQNLLLLSTVLMCTGFHMQFWLTIFLIDLAQQEKKDWSPHLRDENKFWNQAAYILTHYRAFLLPVTIKKLSSQLFFLVWEIRSISVLTFISHHLFISEQPFIITENLHLLCWNVKVISSYTEPSSSDESFKLKELLMNALRNVDIEFAEIIKILNCSSLFVKNRLSIRRAKASLDILDRVLQSMISDFSVRNSMQC